MSNAYITFGLQVVESSSLVSVHFREAFSEPYISFFIYVVLLVSILFFKNPSLPYNYWLAVSVVGEELNGIS